MFKSGLQESFTPAFYSECTIHVLLSSRSRLAHNPLLRLAATPPVPTEHDVLCVP